MWRERNAQDEEQGPLSRARQVILDWFSTSSSAAVDTPDAFGGGVQENQEGKRFG